MLKQTEHEDASAPNAASVRVTPEELAAALAHLDADKPGQDSTIAIGRAVEELSLDAAPEDILRAVEAARQQTARRRRNKRRGLAALLAALAAVGGLGTAKWALSPRHAPAEPITEQQSVPISAPPAALPAHIQVVSDLVVGDRAEKLVLLSEVGDNQPVRCTYSDGAFQQYAPGPSASARWTLIKHDGRVYVRGWILKMSPKVLAEQGAVVSFHSGRNLVPITLPVCGFDVDNPSSSDDSSFQAVNIRLDKYAYEKWNP